MRVTNAAASLRGHAADGTLSELLSPLHAGGGSSGPLHQHSPLQYQHWMTHHFSLTNSFLERERGGWSDKKIVRPSAGGEDRQTERETERDGHISVLLAASDKH